MHWCYVTIANTLTYAVTLKSVNLNDLDLSYKELIIFQTPEMVIMVGCPASGKSTFRKRYLEPHGYVAVNRDTMGTMQKCIKVRLAVETYCILRNKHTV